MLAVVHTVQVLFLVVSVRLVVRKLGQLRGAAPSAASAGLAEPLLVALAGRDVPALATLAQDVTGYQRDLLEAAIDGLEGGGDAGAFIHTASLEAQHEAIAGARVIRGFATLAGSLGLLGAMAHHFWMLNADHGPGIAEFSAANQSADRGAIVSMGLGLGTAAFLYLSSRVIRSRIVARLGAIVHAATTLEAAVQRHDQWTKPTEG